MFEMLSVKDAATNTQCLIKDRDTTVKKSLPFAEADIKCTKYARILG